MLRPTDIAFRNIEPSPAIEAAVEERVAKLEKYFQPIHGCTVVIDAPHRKQHKGTIYSVSIDVVVPGGELVVNRDGALKNHAHEDVYVAIRDAFDAMQRQLKAFADKNRDH